MADKESQRPSGGERQQPDGPGGSSSKAKKGRTPSRLENLFSGLERQPVDGELVTPPGAARPEPAAPADLPPATPVSDAGMDQPGPLSTPADTAPLTGTATPEAPQPPLAGQHPPQPTTPGSAATPGGAAAPGSPASPIA